jgi:ribonuclease HI
MNDPTPHYLLMAEVSRTEGFGRWRFVLRPVDGSEAIEVADVEPDTWGERLDLLTVVRALESLDQPSWVTLIDCTRYVQQGIQYGLAEWRENGWRWEWFGQMAPVRDADLWQRMDRILQIHRVDCGRRRFDTEHAALVGPHQHEGRNGRDWVDRIASADWLKYGVSAMVGWCGVWMETSSRLWQKALALGLGFSVLSSAWRCLCER